MDNGEIVNATLVSSNQAHASCRCGNQGYCCQNHHSAGTRAARESNQHFRFSEGERAIGDRNRTANNRNDGCKQHLPVSPRAYSNSMDQSHDVIGNNISTGRFGIEKFEDFRNTHRENESKGRSRTQSKVSISPVKELNRNPQGCVQLAKQEIIGANGVQVRPIILKHIFIGEPLEESKARAITELECLRKTSVDNEIGSDRCSFILNHLFSVPTSRGLTIGLEFCPGGDLHGLLYSDSGKSISSCFSMSDRLFYLAELVVAIHHLHSLGIYHGDIKLSNVFIASNGHIKLGDFGASKLLPLEEEHEPLLVGRRRSFSDGSAIVKQYQKIVTSSGTIPYCAPEVLFRRPHRFEPDWWSLGVIVCELFTGTTPFQSFLLVNDQAALSAICYSDMGDLLNRLSFPNLASRSFAEMLLTRNQDMRLMGKRVFWHPIFERTDWEDVNNVLMTAPFIPNTKGCFDVHYFNDNTSHNDCAERPKRGLDDLEGSSDAYYRLKHIKETVGTKVPARNKEHEQEIYDEHKGTGQANQRFGKHYGVANMRLEESRPGSAVPASLPSSGPKKHRTPPRILNRRDLLVSCNSNVSA